MEAYYDSDEDVYWGPITLKEKKKDLFRPVSVKNIKQRRSIGCDPTFTAETTKRAEDLVEMEETNSLKPRRSSYPKDLPESGFIEKLAQVLDITADTSSYHTAVEYLKSDENNIAPSDTLDDIKSSSDIFDSAPSSILLDNIQCTLYNSTHFQTLLGHNKTINKTNETSYKTANFLGTNEVISVSDGDGEVDSTFDGRFEVRSPGHAKTHVTPDEFLKNYDIKTTFDSRFSRKENMSPVFGENVSSDDCKVTSSFDQFVNEEGLSSLHVNDGIILDQSDDALATDNLVSVSDTEGDANLTFDGQIRKDNMSSGQDVLPGSSGMREVTSSVSDADILLSDDSLQDTSANSDPSGNDSNTSDQHDIPRPPEIRIYNCSNIETNRLTNVLGNLDIVEEVDGFESTRKFEIFSSSKSVQNTSSVTQDNSDSSDVQFNDTLEEMERLLNQGLNYTMADEKPVVKEVVLPIKKEILTPVRNIIHPIKSAKKPTQFKSPITFNTPSTLPKVTRNKFRNIQSPVATYIKNAGTTPLIQKVTPSREMNRIPIKQKKENQENANPRSFPGVRYKPAKQRLITKEEFKLPSSIDSLIPIKATVTKHKERIGKSSTTSIILDGDLTVSSDVTMNTTDDISILVSKNAFIS